MIEAALHTFKLPYPGSGEKTVWVYVPAHDEKEILPVVYMTDGQNLFDEKSTPYGSWQVVSAVENERKNGFPGAIIAGIDNGGGRRDCELTPASIGEVRYLDMLCADFKPEGESFDDFLVNTVMPFVKLRFPAAADKRFTAVCGSSSGGLMSFFSAVEHPDKFGCAGVFSPAFLCYGRQAWEKYLERKMTDYMPYLYIYTGCGDTLEQMIYKSTETMYALLEERFYSPLLLNEVILPENKHNEIAWRKIFPDFLHTFLSRI